MFEASLVESKVFKHLIDSMKDMVETVNIDCSTSGISLQSMDGAHVSLISLKMRSEAFSHYRCDKAITMGLNLVNLAKILKCSGLNDSLSLTSGENADDLMLSFEAKAGDRTSDFQLRLMDLEVEHLEVPVTEYLAIVKLPSKLFSETIKNLITMGETCSINVSKNGIRFGVGGDMGTGNITLKPSEGAEKEDERITIEMSEPVEAVFALQYLNNFTKATPLSPFVTLSISPNVPMSVDYAVDGTGYIRYYLAPKIDEENAESGDDDDEM